MLAVLTVLVLLSTVTCDEAAPPTPAPILSGPLATLDIRDAEIAAVRGQPKGTKNVPGDFSLDSRLAHRYYLIRV
jgi:hypothetical protein